MSSLVSTREVGHLPFLDTSSNRGDRSCPANIHEEFPGQGYLILQHHRPPGTAQPLSGSRGVLTVTTDANLTFEDSGSQFPDACVFPPNVEDLAPVVHHDVPIADLEGMVEVVRDKYGNIDLAADALPPNLFPNLQATSCWCR